VSGDIQNYKSEGSNFGLKKMLSFFRKSLVLSQELGDRAVEAQACYSLGNTYTLLRDYAKAIEFHLRHLAIAQALSDKVRKKMHLLRNYLEFSTFIPSRILGWRRTCILESG
jgi:hypothetical protein